MPTRLTFVRHAEQDPDPAAGDADLPLTEAGREQSEALARVMERRGPYAALYVSPYLRALQTAEVVAARLGLELRQEPGLTEFALRPRGAPTQAEAEEAWSLAARHLHKAPSPESESVMEFYGRVAETVDRLVKRHEDKRILVVSHGGVLKMAFLHLLGIPPERSLDVFLQIDHGGIFEYERFQVQGATRWRLVVANLTPWSLATSG